MSKNSHHTQPDEQLYLSLSNEVAFREMFEKYYSGLCLYAKQFIPDLSTREDIVQDVFCSMWINRKKIDYSIPIRNYLVTSVKNRCLNYLRRNQTESYDLNEATGYNPAYADNNDEMFLLHEIEELFTKTLNSLPEEYRIAFEMSRIENRSSAEIAEVLGVSTRTVERYRNKAIEILRTELKDYLPLLYILFSIEL